jgi:hypothetical protein
MLPIHEETMRFRKRVDIHPKARGKALGLSFLEIDKTGLAATLAATETLKV